MKDGGIECLAFLGGKAQFSTPLHVGQMNLPKWEHFENAFRDIFTRRYYTNHGPLAQELEGRLAEFFGVRHVVTMTNGTIALMLAGFLIAGPQVLVGIALADFASKRAVGVATGFSGAMGYVFGAAVSGVGIGKMVDIWGWESAFMSFVFCALAGAFFFSLTWNARAKVIEDNFKKNNISTE